jgi:hypothetical protein
MSAQRTETLKVWLLRDECGLWMFSFDEPSAATKRRYSRKGRRVVLCRGEMRPDDRALPKRSGR